MAFTPPQEEQLTIIHGQDTPERTLEHRSEAAASPAPQRPRPHIRRVRGAAACWQLCLLPGLVSITLRGRPWAYGSSSGKREPRVHIQLPLWVPSWEPPTLVMPHGDCRGTCRTWPLGIWLWWRGGEGLATTSTQILADQVLPVVSEQLSQRMQPYCSSAEPRWAQSGQGTRQDTGLPDLGPQTKSFASPGGWSALAQAGELSTEPSLLLSVAPSPSS